MRSCFQTQPLQSCLHKTTGYSSPYSHLTADLSSHHWNVSRLTLNAAEGISNSRDGQYRAQNVSLTLSLRQKLLHLQKITSVEKQLDKAYPILTTDFALYLHFSYLSSLWHTELFFIISLIKKGLNKDKAVTRKKAATSCYFKFLKWNASSHSQGLPHTKPDNRDPRGLEKHQMHFACLLQRSAPVTMQLKGCFTVISCPTRRDGALVTLEFLQPNSVVGFSSSARTNSVSQDRASQLADKEPALRTSCNLLPAGAASNALCPLQHSSCHQRTPAWRWLFL